MINCEALRSGLENYLANYPFDHCIVDNFFDEEVADRLAGEFPGLL